MDITKKEIIKMINSAIELALLDKCNAIHEHNDIYHQKNEIYTKLEIDSLINNNKTIINNLISDEVMKMYNELANTNIVSNESKEKKINNIIEHLKQIDKFVNSISKTLDEININYESINKIAQDYLINASTLVQDVKKIKECIPQLVTVKEFNSQFEVIEKKVFGL